MIGVYSTDEEAQNANEPIDNVITVPDKTKYGGDAKWQDTDGNGVIDSKDRVALFTASTMPFGMPISPCICW